MTFIEMAERSRVIDPNTGHPVNAAYAGQYPVTFPLFSGVGGTPAALGSISADAVGFNGAKVSGNVVTIRGEVATVKPYEEPPGSLGTYWWDKTIDYRYTGDILLAVIPGDFFNASIYPDDPPYEGGGQYVIGGLLPPAEPVNFPIPSPPWQGQTIAYQNDRLTGGYEARGIAPLPWWRFKLVSTPCWVLLFMERTSIDEAAIVHYDGRWPFSLSYELGPGAGPPGPSGVGNSGGTQFGNTPTTVQMGSSGTGGVLAIFDQLLPIAAAHGAIMVSDYRPGERLDSGEFSDHAFNTSSQAARDYGVAGVDALLGPPPPQLDAAIGPLGAFFGRSYVGGVEVIDTFEWRGYRVQFIWRTPLYGGHLGHIHIGIKAL